MNRRRRLLNHYVAAVAGLAVLGGAGAVVSAPARSSGTAASVLVVVFLAAVSLWFPLLRTGSAGARTYSLVETSITAALLLLDPRRALMAFVAGIAIGWLASRRSLVKTAFGIAEHTVAASIAVLVVETAERMGLPGGPHAYIPLAVGCYFVANVALNCAVFHLAALRRPGEPFFIEVGPSAVVAAVGMVTGGFVGLLGQAGPGQVALAVIPVCLVLLLCNAFANRGRTLDLLQGVVAAVGDTHAGMSTDEVEAAVCRRVVQVLDCPSAALRAEPPVEPEIGVAVVGGRSQWLVAQPRPVEAFRPEETDLLRALAGVASRALENASLQEQLANQALHDPLTGAPNRRLLISEIEAALARARRTGDRVGVAFLDLTEFKSVNDRLGHDAGDELLRRVTERLARAVRAGDVVGRFGGDEFVVLFPALDDAALASVGRRVLDAFEEPFPLAHTAVSINCNIGVATWPVDGDTAEDLLSRADAAMYRAKGAGGNTIAWAVAG